MFLAFPEHSLFAQHKDSLKCRKVSVELGYSVAYAGSMTILYQAWYKNYPQTSFHWFNDNAEWLQMDKAGHAFTSFQLARANTKALQWAGYNKQQSEIYGTISSLLTMCSIEGFDGFSANWGASYGDIIANTSGAALFFTQNYFFHKSPFFIKYSFHFTDYPAVRPDELGKTKIEQLLKDYNGQTYWLSINIHDLFSSFKPHWLNLAIGYSATDMISARFQPIRGCVGNLYSPRRQFFLSLDIAPSKINIRQRWLKTLLKTFEIIKIPFPALEYSAKHVYFHGVYF
jgi:uncharacterized protein YfiM (DUF2279 family)